METFVLLPFFLLSRVPSDADTWRHGPEYTFAASANATVERKHSINFSVYQFHSTLTCRPRDSETLHCHFDQTVQEKSTDFQEDDKNWFQAPFDIKFDRQGIQSLVVFPEVDSFNLDMIRAIVQQMNLGVQLLHKPDGAFHAKEKTYIGQCEALVNVSRETQSGEVSRKQDYEIVPMTGLQKKRGETLVIEKTRDLERCTDKRMYMMSGMETQLLSSFSRIEISDMGFDSYTVSVVTVTHEGVLFKFREKISLNLISILPAKEPLTPSKATTTVTPYILDKVKN